MTKPKPVVLQVNEFHDTGRVLRWSRSNRDDISDPGRWDGEPAWVVLADALLAGRLPVVVLRPNIIYHPNPAAGTTVEAVAAAMIGAVAGRADVTALLDELPAHLFGDDDPGEEFRIH